jgi:hypothetical protein
MDTGFPVDRHTEGSPQKSVDRSRFSASLVKNGGIMRLTLTILGCLLASLAWADLTVIQKEAGYTETTSTTYMKNDCSATRDSVSGVILDFANNKITLIDMPSKSFCTASMSDYHQQAVQFAADTRKKLMDQAIEQMMAYGQTREEAESVIKSLQGMAKPDSSLYLPVESLIGDSKVIAGFNATSYLIKQNGNPTRLVWISTDLQKRIDKEIDPSKAKAMQDQLKKIEEEMEKAFSDGIVQRVGLVDSLQTVLEEGGYLMATLLTVNGSLVPQNEITEINEKPIDPAIFRIPDGFRPLSIMELFEEQYARSQE